ncbi:MULTISPECIES: hypothetical protein [Saccharothrix]|uniref:hypothetical protein n=1 Tax=Saccharothrix TaxID=2071 RepID=UPI00093A670A|nr:hypothetical protein [Saccharothrix sp. CB00851]OKI13913.1 hypothetical protein A6A25_16730 [Saccharothrix sp. CB00851]
MDRVRVTSKAQLGAAGLPVGRPVLVLVGGAGGMEPGELDALASVLRDLVPLLDECGAVVVDGGTDVGVMRAVGRARAAAGGRFPLVGVAAEVAVDLAAFEPNHTHLVLVPGRVWGDESPWLAEVADVVAGPAPSLTVLVNGGPITFDDAEHSLARDRPLVVLRGSGRTADAIAESADARSTAIATSPLTTVLDRGDLLTHVERVLRPARR